jgi:exosortase/archaeosortase family protein
MIVVWLLVLAAICLDSLLAPALNTLAPALSCGLLLLLLLRQQPASAETEKAGVSPFPHKWRIVAFLLLHATAVVVARRWQSSLLELPTSGLLSVAIATAKYLILLPTIVLMGTSEWRVFGRVHRLESVAALFTLFTVYPFRAFHSLWPWYSQVLGHTVYWLARSVVHGLNFLPERSPILAGPALEVVVIEDCGGLGAVKLFQVLFAVVLIADWNSLKKGRTVVAYWLGMGIMLLANALRISLLVIVGNRFPVWVLRHHIVASWIFLAAGLVACLFMGYRWLFSPNQDEWEQKRLPSVDEQTCSLPARARMGKT